MSRAARFAALACLTLAASPASAEVVLLRTGYLLEGAIERAPGEVIVRGDGSLIRLPTAEVAHVAPNAVAAYEWKRGQSGAAGMTAADHLELAEWALRNRLWPQAARELLDARQQSPRSRRLALLERRLDELIRPVAAKSELPETPPTNEPGALTGTEPPKDPPVDLPKLPPGALEQFTRRIQPVLLNGCATSGCHGGDDVGGFALDLAPLRGYGDARSTERNLQAALAAIDVHQPAESPLLAAAQGPHAGVSPLSGPRRDEMLARLGQWIAGIAAHNAPAGAENPEDVEPALPEAPAEPQRIASTDEPDWEAIVATEQPSVAQKGAQLTRVGPRDEFDPELFNSRYRRPQDDEPLGQ